MADRCCAPASPSGASSPRFRRVLWVALIVNFTMFAVEIAGSMASGSVALLADAIDFAGDSANYGLSLAVLSRGVAWRARAALAKGVAMGGFGLGVLAVAAYRVLHGEAPEPFTMGAVAIMALIANVAVAGILFAFREGDANMRSVWLCSRNDAIGNLAVILAAFAVVRVQSNWPDLAVATLMALLALHSSFAIVRQARQELSTVPMPSH